MGSLRYFKINGHNKEFETYLVYVSKARADDIRKSLKRAFSNQVMVRVTKSPHNPLITRKGVLYDVYTCPDEREFHKLKMKGRL